MSNSKIFRWVGSRFYLFCALGLVRATSAGVHQEAFPATPDDLRGHVSFDCSGAMVRLERDLDRKAVFLTNGHCAKNEMIEPGNALVNVPYDRGELRIFVGGAEPESVVPTKILYATMTGTDIALIELNATYRELEAKGARTYEISDRDARTGSSVMLVSGAERQKRLCAVSHVVDRLVEDRWTYSHVLAMKDLCAIDPAWSGTPLVDPNGFPDRPMIVGIVSSRNRDGGLCTLDNPCEVDSDGERLAFRDRAYAQSVAGISDCVTKAGEISLSKRGCRLQKPKTANRPSSEPQPTPERDPEKKPRSSFWPQGKKAGTP
jgi:hypothetical protein